MTVPNDGKAEFPAQPPNLSGLSDVELVRAAIAGDLQRREELGLRLLIIPRILRAINGRYGIGLATQDVEDLSQDVFVVVWGKLDQFHGPGPLDPWVYRICQFRFQNYRRELGRNSARMAPNADQLLPSVSEKPAAEFDYRSVEVETCMATLNEATQEILRLHHVEGWTLKEVADHKQEQVSKVKSRYYRGLDQLRKALGVRPQFPDEGQSAS